MLFWWGLYKSDPDCTDKVSSCKPSHLMSFAVFTAPKLRYGASRLWHRLVPAGGYQLVGETRVLPLLP
jgi:hypothetical protein